MGEVGGDIELLYFLLRRGEGDARDDQNNMGRVSGAEMVVFRSAASGAGAARSFSGSRGAAQAVRRVGGSRVPGRCWCLGSRRPFGAGIR